MLIAVLVVFFITLAPVRALTLFLVYAPIESIISLGLEGLYKQTKASEIDSRGGIFAGLRIWPSLHEDNCHLELTTLEQLWDSP